MSSVRHPKAKKGLAYARDHYVRSGESAKAFRKKWPIKKRKSMRALRQQLDRLTKKAAAGDDEVSLSCVNRRPLQKWGQVSLREFVASRMVGREQRASRKKT